MDRWNDRVALVTGASVGIGAAICRALVKHGIIVVGCARNVQKIQDIANEDDVKKSSGRLIAMKCDLTNESEILSMFKEIQQKYGRLDICINNAGLAHNSPLLSGKTSEFKNILDVNILALCICTRESVKMMQESGITDGQIIHISSMGGHRLAGMAGTHFYCGTKFMVRALTEGLRKELKEIKSKIRIASISPGVVETEFFPRYLSNDPTKSAETLYRSMQCLEPSDIADAVIYILGTAPHVEVHDILLRPREQTS